MNSSVAPPVEKPRALPHGCWLHGRHYICIMKDCDGTHHVMCSCEH